MPLKTFKPTRSALGAFIRRHRYAQDLTQEQLAERAGVSRNNLASWETRGQSILLDNFIDLCSALNVDARKAIEEFL